MTIYGANRTSAARMISAKGQALTITRRASGAYNTATGLAAIATSTQSGYGVVLPMTPYRKAQNSNIVDGDQQLLLSALNSAGAALTTPHVDDTVTLADSSVATIVAIDQLEPDGTPIFFDCVVRRAPAADAVPSWLPEGATDGIDFTRGTTSSAWLGGALYDLSGLLGGAYDGAAVSSAGMAVLAVNANRPQALGAFLTKLIGADYCCVIDWDFADPASGDLQILAVSDDAIYTSASIALDVGASGGDLWCSEYSGDYNTVGTLADVSNKIAFSLNEDGVLASLNGETAVLSSGIVGGALTYASIGFTKFSAESSARVLNGSIRSIFFYPNGKDAAELEALSS